MKRSKGGLGKAIIEGQIEPFSLAEHLHRQHHTRLEQKEQDGTLGNRRSRFNRTKKQREVHVCRINKRREEGVEPLLCSPPFIQSASTSYRMKRIKQHTIQLSLYRKDPRQFPYKEKRFALALVLEVPNQDQVAQSNGSTSHWEHLVKQTVYPTSWEAREERVRRNHFPIAPPQGHPPTTTPPLGITPLIRNLWEIFLY